MRLAIDTSGAEYALIALDGRRLIGADDWVRARNDAPVLTRLDALVKRAGVRPEDLDSIVAARGPGSFTGLRVGLSVAAGLAYARHVALYLAGFRVLTGPRVRLRDHLPGAVVAGVAWTGLQALGGYLVAHQLRHASQVYGFFGVVLGLVSWIFLVAQITIYAAEVNAVRVQRLWPRSIVQPPLTPQDERELAAIARREERRPEEKVEVTFD